MNMNYDKFKEIENEIKSLSNSETEEESINHDAFMLMAGYLSEIEKLQSIHNFRRNKIAKLTGISSSYLTQVFRGNKPLNFNTLAKIQRALKIRFEVYAQPIADIAFQLSTTHQMSYSTTEEGSTKLDSNSKPFTVTIGGMYHGNSDSTKTA